MNAVLSVLFGGGLAVLIYGLSFIPSANLGQDDDAEASVELTASKAVEDETQTPR